MVSLHVLLPEAGTATCVSLSSNAKNPTFALGSPVMAENVYLGTTLPSLSTSTQLESPHLKSQPIPELLHHPSSHIPITHLNPQGGVSETSE